MKMNLPIVEQLADCQNILIAGAGGGFDIFIGLPLFYTLREMGKTVHLANYSFCDIHISTTLSENPIVLREDLLIGVQNAGKLNFPFFAEGYLAEWLNTVKHEPTTVWMFSKTGAVELEKNYQTLITHLGGIDALILVDGGVDSLMRGDEDRPGTLLEDSISLAAVEFLDVPVKILVCAGFGTEVEEGLCHHHALENIAALAKAGAFWGSCALTPQMPAFQYYEAGCRYVWEKPDHHKSHISTRIIPAVQGEFGDFVMYPDQSQANALISPLMSLYWFFDAKVVIERSLITDAIRHAQSVSEAFMIYNRVVSQMKRRPKRALPY